MKQIVLTGIRKLYKLEYVDTPESFVNGPANPELLSEMISETAQYKLIFNDGLFELHCDEEIFEKVTEFFRPVVKTDTKTTTRIAKITPTNPKRVAVLPTIRSEAPEGVELFSATEEEPPPPPEMDSLGDNTDWSGEPDEAEDGVVQL